MPHCGIAILVQCTYCGDFKWGRPYQLRKHLKKGHPNADPDDVLGGLSPGPIARSPLSQNTHRNNKFHPLPLNMADRQDRAESRLCAWAPPPSAMVPVSPLFDASAYACASAAISSTEEHAQRANDLEIASRNGQI